MSQSILTDHSRSSSVLVRQLQLYSWPSEAMNFRWRDLYFVETRHERLYAKGTEGDEGERGRWRYRTLRPQRETRPSPASEASLQGQQTRCSQVRPRRRT